MLRRQENAATFALQSRWLSAQSSSFQTAFCAFMTFRQLKRDETLFQVEDDAHELYFLASGALIGRVAHPVNGLQASHTVLPGSWFGEAGALGRNPRVVAVQARKPSTLLAVSQTSLDRLLRSNPEFAWPLFVLMSHNSQEYLLRNIDLLIQDPRLRMCSRLLTLAGRITQYLPPSPVSIPISREELAMMSNLSRQSVHIYLAELVGLGICSLRYREIVVEDVEALSNIISRDQLVGQQ